MLSHFYLSAVEGEKISKSNSPVAVLKMPSMLIVLPLTFKRIVYQSLVCLALAIVVALLAKRTLRSSSVSSVRP